MKESTRKISRREFLLGLGASIAVAAIPKAVRIEDVSPASDPKPDEIFTEGAFAETVSDFRLEHALERESIFDSIERIKTYLESRTECSFGVDYVVIMSPSNFRWMVDNGFLHKLGGNGNEVWVFNYSMEVKT